ncbi:hypothetical protein ACFFU8_09405 [Chromobacterium piscinae]|uniref:Uncharacterized protein n=1 Tax=Chromobacterium fluminis TaxID=3044269 RepID=A0ABX0L0D1_9NEIS|nr:MULTISPECIES: hypothetical protein [Chromobacterium]MCD5327879.1 hypothetical protein [Chromobacterium piscinae]NHR04388.1 hypothetical protein [Chromobacterium haemolyticum]
MTQNILMALLIGAVCGIGYVLSKIYGELQYANDLKSFELKAKGVELPEQ